MKWIQSAARPERQADGATLWDGVVIDITDRKQTEEEKSRFLAILEATSDMVGIADAQGNSIYLNPAGQELLQIPAAQMDRIHISEMIPLKDLPVMQNERLPTAVREGIWSGEAKLHTRNGEEIPVSQVLMAHKNDRGEVEFFSTIIRDIRERKRTEAERLQKSVDLEQALANLQETQLQMVQNEKMSALGNLVAGVAHEINNPVGFIAGNLNEAQNAIQDLVDHLNLYRDRAPEAEITDHAEEIDLDYILKDLPQMIDSMKIGCERIKTISTSLRTFSRADQNHAVQVNLHEGIDSTIMILKHRLKANEFHPEIQVVREYGDLPKVECYAGQLNQVFMNILANAIDALEESNQGRNYEEIHNQITIKTEVSLDRWVIIRIQDNGKGMTEEVKQKIFEHLFTTKGMGKGTGLGLAIAQQIIVEKHRGSIEVNSTLGVGTEFIIILPIN
jgi:PAS domain S-box-containing protein